MPDRDLGTLLTVEDVSKMLRISERTVYRMCEVGELVSMKVGNNSIRIPEKHVKAYLQRQLNEKIYASSSTVPVLEEETFSEKQKKWPTFISVVNHKGGVGKSEIVKELGAFYSAQNKKVLLVDCDPQGNLSSDLNWYPVSEDGTPLTQLIHVLTDHPYPLKDVIKNTAYERLDIIPNSVFILPHEHAISTYIERERLFTKYFKREENEGLTQTYDYVIFDCPPSANIIVTNALIASDFYLVPVQVTKKSLDGTFSFSSYMNSVKEMTKIYELGKVLTFWDARKNEPLLIERRLRDEIGGYIFKTKIRDLAEISSDSMPKVLKKFDSDARRDMLAFCLEFDERLHSIIHMR